MAQTLQYDLNQGFRGTLITSTTTARRSGSTSIARVLCGALVMLLASAFTSPTSAGESVSTTSQPTSTRPARRTNINPRLKDGIFRGCEQIDRIVDDPELFNALDRGECISDELQTLGDHEWAGVYSCGLFSNLALSPDMGLVSWGCEGLHWCFLINHGEIVGCKGGVIELKLAIDPAKYRRPPSGCAVYSQSYVSSSMVPIRWDRFQFLVPIERMRGFCNAVNGGWCVPKHYYARFTDRNGRMRWAAHIFEKSPPTGLPRIPGEFQKYLLRTPVSAVVTDVRALTRDSKLVGPYDREERWVFATLALNVGRKHGILPEMELYALAGPRRNVGTVTDASEETCTVRFLAQPNVGEDFTEPRVGAGFCTLYPKREGRDDRLVLFLWRAHLDNESLNEATRTEQKTDANP